METEFQSAIGKGIGEVLRDIEEFLSTRYVINEQKKIDLCSLVPELNMYEQFSFALLSEARAQGWAPEAAESFFRRAVSGVLDADAVDAILALFAERGETYAAWEKKYGNRFYLLDGSYWSTVLALGIDAGQVGDVMQYLRLFCVVLMEFAYMEGKNPELTYTWEYYESFRRMLDELTAEPEPDPQPIKVRALGGSAGKREGEGYLLSLGIDLENPNPDRMARAVALDVTLKDKNGEVITVIKDQIQSIDPGAIYHYAVTRRVRGAATAGISAVAHAASYLKLSTPIMKHIKLDGLRVTRDGEGMKLSASLVSEYDVPLRSVILHYQFLNEDNRILGGDGAFVLGEVAAGSRHPITATLPVPMGSAKKVVYSVDFDAIELIR